MKHRSSNSPCLRAFLGALTVTTSALFMCGAHAEGLAKSIILENQQPNEVYKGRVLIFEPSKATSFNATIEVDLKDVFCRSGGTDPDTPIADQVGGAFHSLNITTINAPRTRLHIFNTNCLTQTYKGTYLLTNYLKETGQIPADIFDSPVTIEIMFERDQDGDGFFENYAVELRGTN